MGEEISIGLLGCVSEGAISSWSTVTVELIQTNVEGVSMRMVLVMAWSDLNV